MYMLFSYVAACSRQVELNKDTCIVCIVSQLRGWERLVAGLT